MLMTQYSHYCTCGILLKAKASATGKPSAVICTCGAEHATETIMLDWTTMGYQDADPDSRPRHERITTPLSIDKRRKYASLEEAERRRAARVSGDDDEE